MYGRENNLFNVEKFLAETENNILHNIYQVFSYMEMFEQYFR